jgi:hypothetical protein
LPISYLFLKEGYEPEVTFIVSIFLSATALFGRLIVLKPLANFPVAKFLKQVLFTVVIVALMTVVMPIFSQKFVSGYFIQFITVCFATLISLFTSIWFFGLSKSEKLIMKSYISKRFIKKPTV